MSALPPAPDPYAPRVSLWQRHPQLGWGLAVFILTTLLTYVSFPPGNTGEAAYVFLVPAVLWACRRPAFKTYAAVVLGAQVLAWTLLLGWLHHVTWVGLFLLGPFVGLLIGLWHLAAWWALPRIIGQATLVRLVALLGLASLWVMLEWLRGWVFGGFPWLPLAASQWQRPLVLQAASVGGAWAVSFILVCFNLGAAAYAHRIFYEGATGLRKRSPEFMLALMLLVFASFPFLGDIMGAQRRPLVRLALVQPAIPQGDKWDDAKAREVLRTVEQVTLQASRSGTPEALLLPEAVAPWALFRDPNVGPWFESLARRTGKPLLLGTIFTRGPESEPQWFNGAAVVDPVAGLAAPVYAKRQLVPFGEFVPLRPVLGWIGKFAPIGGDFQPGDEAAPLVLPLGRDRVAVGVLICYEDIFPGLARASVRAGAEVLAVLSNNAWFGEGGAAYQHAAHSVLRAVENRRPVVRVGNSGWSGWIDEYGRIRGTVQNAAGSIYFRGAATVAVTRDLRWHGRLTTYAERGDWLLPVCAVLATLAFYLVATLRPAAPPADGRPRF